MDTVILQVPMARSFRDEMADFVEKMGLSSIQDYVRLIFKKSLNGELGVHLGPKPITLSAKKASVYDNMISEINSGKETIYESKNVSDLLDQLYGRKDPLLKKISKKL